MARNPADHGRFVGRQVSPRRFATKYLDLVEAAKAATNVRIAVVEKLGLQELGVLM